MVLIDEMEIPHFYVMLKLREIAEAELSDEWVTAEELSPNLPEEMTMVLERLVIVGRAKKALAYVGDQKEWVYKRLRN